MCKKSLIPNTGEGESQNPGTRKCDNDININYRLPTCIIGAIFLVVGIVLGFKAFNVNIWSIGIIVLLFLTLVLGLATLISLIATFREIGRKQAREYSDEMKNINNRLDKLESNEELKKRIENLNLNE